MEARPHLNAQLHTIYVRTLVFLKKRITKHVFTLLVLKGKTDNRFSVYRGTTYNKDDLDSEDQIINGTRASGAFEGKISENTYEIGAVTDYTMLPNSFIFSDIQSRLNAFLSLIHI